MANRGISPVVSYVLILALLVIIAIGSYMWATYTQERLQDKMVVTNMENQMIGLATVIENVAHGDINYTLTQTVYYPKGILEVEPEKDWIRFIVQTNSEVYPIEDRVPEALDSCTSSSIVIQDSDTSVTMSKVPFTSLYRGAVGNELGERVEMVICFPDIDLVTGGGCIGKSGPSSRVTIKKIGYAGTKPRVMVQIC